MEQKRGSGRTHMSGKKIRVQLASQRLRPAVKEFIDGDVIDLSTASEFYKKKAETIGVLEDFVQILPNSRYRLKGNFLEFVRDRLPFTLKNNLRDGADALADSLFDLGRCWAILECGKRQRVHPLYPLHERLLIDTWREIAADWIAFREGDGHSGEIWHYVLEEDSTIGQWSESNPRQVRIRVNFSNDPEEPPAMAIHLEGEGALKCMSYWINYQRAMQGLAPYPSGELRAETSVLLDSVLKNVKNKLGLLRLERGRPALEFGERAAYLFYHEKKSLRAIVRELPSNSQNRRQELDRVRKMIQNYFASLRREFKSNLPVK